MKRLADVSRSGGPRPGSGSRATPLDVIGGIALNQHTGGVNPATVRSALASGGRVVWFPTADSHTQAAACLPRLSDQDARLPRTTYAVPPVDRTLDATHRARLVLDLIADYDALLCTGHVSLDECRWLLDEAQTRGIGRFLLTHPSYTVPDMPLALIESLAERGAQVEITAYQLLHQPGMTPAQQPSAAAGTSATRGRPGRRGRGPRPARRRE
ncbi:DUF6282 family protein [Arsenicicoccus piscis]|uniref:DUF6282 family protein n=1 Tax=Arsenicicoccus piscis TaxID=673954 RepID=UPI001F4CE127|nr:DUF6282 family protein [Arsenicicoccus piscis]